ncbi:MAG: acyltransferase [Armatimonadetes bacterium]|nr:acyltransferase [Armatimonadota bacterium]
MRLVPLDVLRGVAVLLVLASHFQFTFQAHPVSRAGLLLARVAGAGWMGVDLFFVLSGFLVSGLLYREHRRHGELRGLRFLARRGFKIYPAYWLLILVSCLVDDMPAARLDQLKCVATQLGLIQNYVCYRWDHTWSLAVEEHFYLLLTLAFTLLVRRRTAEPFRPVAWAVPLLGLTVAAWRCWLRAAHAEFDWLHQYAASHVRLDELAWGVWLGYLHHHHADRLAAFAARRRPWLCAAVVIGFLPPTFAELSASWYLPTLGFSALAGGSMALVLLAVYAPEGARPGRLTRLLALTGLHSYSIYLFHRPVGIGFGWLMAHHVFPAADNVVVVCLMGAAFVGASISAGILVGLGLEQPMLRLRDRVVPSRAGSAARPA